MKPWQAPLNKAPSKGGKGRTKREYPTLGQKSETQSGSQRGKGTKTLTLVITIPY